MFSRKVVPGISAAALVMSLVMVPGMVQAESLYAGLGFGNAKSSNDTACSELNGLMDPGYSCSSDATDTGTKAFIGYQIGNSVAAELAYVDLGKYKVSASGTVASVPSTAGLEAKAKGYNLSLVANFPVNANFSFLVRAGLFRWDVKLSASASGGLVAGSSESASGTDLASGLGVQYDFSKSLGMRAEWQRFMDVGNPDTTGKSDVDLTSLSLVFKF